MPKSTRLLLENEEKKKQAEKDAQFEIAKINAGLIENGFERSVALLSLDLSKELENIANSSYTDETKQRLGSARKNEFNKKVKDLKSEELVNNSKLFISTLSESVSIATQIGEIFNLGAHTFVAQLLNGLQQGLSLANSIISFITSISSLASGGFFSKIFSFFPFASGGVVPGSGNGDTVPAMLTPGEFIISKPNVSRLISTFGNNFLSFLNPGSMLPKFSGSYNSGGFVIPPMSYDRNVNHKFTFDKLTISHSAIKASVKKADAYTNKTLL